MTDRHPGTAIVDAVDEAAAVDWLRRAVQTPSITGDEMAFAALVASPLKAVRHANPANQRRAP